MNRNERMAQGTKALREVRPALVPALPSLVAVARDDYRASKPWSVVYGKAERGEAFTDYLNRRVQLPAWDQAQDSPLISAVIRAVRGHELAHVRISPDLANVCSCGCGRDIIDLLEAEGIPRALVMACEEVRVNEVLRHSGLDPNALTDGSEERSGLTVKEWNEAMAFMVGLHGTKAQSAFLKGVKKARPDMELALRKAKTATTRATTRLRKRPYRFNTNEFSYSIRLRGEYHSILMPAGFHVTRDMAVELLPYWQSTTSDQRTAEAQENAGVKSPTGVGRGVFAPLIFDPEVKPTRPVKGAVHARRNAPAQRGRKLAYPSRVLTDPEKRVFRGVNRTAGGVVCIDVSGSMSLTESDVTRILDAAPYATIFCYSSVMYDLPRPNAWLVAWNGLRVESMEDVYQRYSRNGGNGCDGPAIEHAVAISAGRSRPGLVTREEARTARYSKNVPVFWVCDGQLTDSTDGAVRGELLRSVARFVVRNKVRVAPNVETAVAMLTGRLSTYSVAWGRLGSVIPKHKGGQA